MRTCFFSAYLDSALEKAINDSEEGFVIISAPEAEFKILILLQAGMQFGIYYSDGRTPIE